MTIKRVSGKKFGLSDLEKRTGRLSVARFLRSWRESEDLSQKEFARVLGISPANLCDIEKGRKGISLTKAAEIARVLGYPEEVLVGIVIADEIAAAGLDYRVQLIPAA